MTADGDLTPLIRRMRAGDDELSAEVFARVYEELRALARQRMAAERSDHTLQATALVHEQRDDANGGVLFERSGLTTCANLHLGLVVEISSVSGLPQRSATHS